MSRRVGLVLLVEEAKEVKEPSKFDGMGVDELKAYAAENSIDIGSAGSVKGITKKILDAEKQ